MVVQSVSYDAAAQIGRAEIPMFLRPIKALGTNRLGAIGMSNQRRRSAKSVALVLLEADSYAGPLQGVW
jgi:hypothetical protein